MRLVYLIAGSGRMECDVCLRDAQTVRAIRARGHDVIVAPLYTPLASILAEGGEQRLFYGGINVYLQHRWALFRYTPRAIDRLLDHPRLLRWATRRGSMTRAADLADLTLAVMRGEDGPQRKELRRLIEWLTTQPRPDAIVLPTSLLAGLAGPLRRALGARVVCLLSGEDAFIDQFPPPYRDRTLEELRRRLCEVDGLLAAGRWYAKHMETYLGLAPGTVERLTPGVDVALMASTPRTAPASFTIGFRSPIVPPTGLHVLAEALVRLRSDPATADCRVRAAGHLAEADRPYWASIRAMLARHGCADAFEYVGELAPAERAAFYASLHVLCVPVQHPDPLGLYVPEALAAGVPVVVPRAGSLVEWVEATGGGVLIDAATPDATATALAALARDAARREALGRAGRDAVRERFHLDAMTDSLLAAIAQMLTRPAMPPPAPRAASSPAFRP